MRQPSVHLRAALSISILVLGAALTGCPPPADRYEGLPETKEFPRTEQSLEDLISRNDVQGMRRHSWWIFCELTKPSRQDRNVARWESWYDPDATFAVSPARPDPAEWPRRLFGKDGEVPSESHGRTFDLESYPLYNREAYRHIRDNCLYLRQTYQCLASRGEKDVPDFPVRAVVLKADWKTVTRGTPVTLGVWNSERPAPGVVQNSHTDWPRQVCVAVDLKECTDPQVKAVSVKDFYNFEIRDKDLNRFRHAGALPSFQRVQPKDYAILIALHFATREQVNWVWSTFWWHPQPKNGPYADGRPENSLVKPWPNYAMSVAYDMDKPREPDGKPHIAFNPYLEGFLQDGVGSNCMSCHRRATWPDANEEAINVLHSDGSVELVPPRNHPRIVVRGSEAATETYFDNPFSNKLKLSFLWTLRRALQQPDLTDPHCSCEQVMARIQAAKAKTPAR